MRKLRKAAVVAVMAGSMGMFGAGVAAAGGHDGGGKGDFIVNNPQFMDCSYKDNKAVGMLQFAGADLLGESTQSMNLGNVCAQTGPVFEG